MFYKETKYSYNDVTIAPAVLSEVMHRKECNPFIEGGKLPIFASPMSTVVDKKNFKTFEDNCLIPILPRCQCNSFSERFEYASQGKWAAFSLSEFEQYFCNEELIVGVTPYKVLIDIANGHMSYLYELVKKAKTLHGNDIIIMVGNVANPLTYEKCWKAGVSYIRCSVGTGSGCLTSTQLSVHYPIASLLDEMYQEKVKIAEGRGIDINTLPKIVADGGVRGYADVIKALSLGADYVMIGGEFSKLIESAAPPFLWNEKTDDIYELSDKEWETLREEGGYFFFTDESNEDHVPTAVYKRFYGMASREGQIDMNGEKTKTSEGKAKTFKCTTNIDKWVNNMEDYLRSAMSYLGIFDVKDLNPKNTKLYIMSNNTKESINK